MYFKFINDNEATAAMTIGASNLFFNPLICKEISALSPLTKQKQDTSSISF